MENLLLRVICLYVNWAAFVHDIDTIGKIEAINSHVHVIFVFTVFMAFANITFHHAVLWNNNTT